jgi:hypothetical protein
VKKRRLTGWLRGVGVVTFLAGGPEAAAGTLPA